MFFYGKPDRLCAIVKYSELETCALLLSATDAMLRPDYHRRKQFAGTVARVFITKGDLRILMDEGDLKGLANDRDIALKDTPPEMRARIEGALAFFVPTDVGLDHANVLVLSSPTP